MTVIPISLLSPSLEKSLHTHHFRYGRKFTGFRWLGTDEKRIALILVWLAVQTGEAL
jgi:hypothetical protein